MDAVNEYAGKSATRTRKAARPTKKASKKVVDVAQEAVAPTDLMTLPEAAAILGISPSNAYRLARKGEFPVPVMRLGGLRKVHRAAMDRYLASFAGGT